MKIYGKNSISERLKVSPKSIVRIFLEKSPANADIEKTIRASHIPIQYFSSQEFKKASRDIPSQGLIAEIGEFEYFDFDELLECSKKEPYVILFLDSLNDPQNLGSILRTAACFGRFSAVIPKHDSVEVTEAVLRVAQGAENYVPVCKAVNLSQAIDKSKAAGYWIGGAVVDSGEDLRKTKLNFPLGIVIGSEGKGIRQGLIRHLDFKLTLSMQGADLTFNAAVAAAIFCYEAVRQRG